MLFATQRIELMKVKAKFLQGHFYKVFLRIYLGGSGVLQIFDILSASQVNLQKQSFLHLIIEPENALIKLDGEFIGDDRMISRFLDLDWFKVTATN